MAYNESHDVYVYKTDGCISSLPIWKSKVDHRKVYVLIILKLFCQKNKI